MEVIWRRVALAVCALCMSVGAMAATASVGRTTGAFSVSDTGAAQYTVPLWSPPGINGMQPSLALAYSSRVRTGYFGAGWSLQGLSVIERCARTWVQDGVARDVRNDLGDRFCLDGQQLKLSRGTYGAIGAEYRTELDAFARVMSYGATENGPASFVVEQKSGLILEYGGTEDSRIESLGRKTVRAWALSKVRDRFGNEMLFVYNEDAVNGSYCISSIRYTQNNNAGIGPHYEVLFAYEDVAFGEIDVAYSASAKIRRVKRVDRVDVTHDSFLIRRYELTYEAVASSAGRSRLASIQECAGATDCLAPTKFTYQNGTPGLSAEVAAGLSAPAGSRPWPLDVNGDGRSDLVYPSSITPGAGTWVVAFADTSGRYTSPIDSGVSNLNWRSATPIDYNADGREDLLMPGANGNWSVLLGTVTGLGSPIDTGAPTGAVAGVNARAIDVDGDGLEDLVWADLHGYAGGDAIRYRLRVLGGTFSQDAMTLVGPLPPDEMLSQIFASAGQVNPVRVPDFNGDGRGDIVYQHSVRSIVDGPGTSNYRRAYSVYCPGGMKLGTRIDSSGVATAFGDFNADGLTDLLYFRGGLSPATVVRFSAGTSFTDEVVIKSTSQYGAPYAVFDWDGDGSDDVLMKNRSTQTWEVFRSTGESFAAPISAGISSAAASDEIISDVTGDGLADIAYIANGNWNLRAHAGGPSDLLLTATDGFGVGVSFDYASLSQGIHTKGADAPFPDRAYQGPLHVVRSFTASTGIRMPSTYTQSYSYSGARINLQGRGFVGFASRRVVDSRNGLVSVTHFRQEFPYTGMLAQADSFQSDGSTLIERTQNALAVKTFGSGTEAHYFPFIERSVEEAFEVGGVRNAEPILRETVAVEVDDFGSPTRISMSTQDKDSQSPGYGQVYAAVTTRTIQNDLSSWCLGRSSQTTVDRALPDGSSATRMQAASIDSTACRITEQVTEPNSATLRVTARSGFDTCGNVNIFQIIGKNPDGSEMPTRTSAANYGNRCQFPLLEVNALAQSSTRAWDYALGLPNADTDSNGVSISRQYDGFGRIVRENRADGTYSVWSRTACGAGPDACSTGEMIYRVTRIDYGTDNRSITQQTVFVDQFDRAVGFVRDPALGGPVEARWSYDDMGQLSSASAPFFASSGPQHLTTYRYDILGRLVEQARDVSGVDASKQSTLAFYEGQTTRGVDALGHQSTQIATVLGQLARTVDHDGHGQNFKYDPFGNVTQVEDLEGRTLQTHSYDVRGMHTASADVDMGSRIYANNSLGEVVSMTDANSNTTTFAYDELSRPLKRVEPDGGKLVTYAYRWGTSAEARNIGRLVSAEIAGPTVRDNKQTYAYDTVGRLARITYSDLEVAAHYQIDRTYSPITGLIETLTYPQSTAGDRFRLQYDYRNGGLYRIRDAHDGSTTFWQADDMDARGNAIQEVFGNGLRTTRQFDAVTGMATRIQSVSSVGATVQDLEYQYDKLGNLIERQDLRQALTERFYYDNLSRLDYSTLNGVTNLDLAYDAIGNITAKSGVGAYSYDGRKLHALTAINGESLHTYDGNGNALGDPRVFSFSHYASNLPKTANWSEAGYASTFFYGPDQQRFFQLARYPQGAESITYVGTLFEKQSTPSRTQWKHYVFTPSGRAAVHTRSSDGADQTYYLTQDPLGSIDSITDTSGAVRARLSYDAHGARRSGEGWSGSLPDEDWGTIYAITHRGFTDHEMLDDLDLIHMNGRLFDPTSGRFVSADPLIQTPTDPQSFNRYSYVRNNPLSATDPTGFVETRVKTQNGHFGDSLATVVISGSVVGTWSARAAYTFGRRAATAGSSAAPGGGHGVLSQRHHAATAPNTSDLPNGHIEIDCSPGLFICDDEPLKPWTGPQEEPLDGLWDDIFFFAEAGPRVAAVAGVRAIANRMARRGVADSVGTTTNAVPRTVARVTSGTTVRNTIGRPGDKDVFVTAADDIAGLNAPQLAQRLSIPVKNRYTVIEFPTPLEGLASPVFRTNPGFVGGGLTGGGAREFVIPNGPIPSGATVRIVTP